MEMAVVIVLRPRRVAKPRCQDDITDVINATVAAPAVPPGVRLRPASRPPLFALLASGLAVRLPLELRRPPQVVALVGPVGRPVIHTGIRPLEVAVVAAPQIRGRRHIARPQLQSTLLDTAVFTFDRISLIKTMVINTADKLFSLPVRPTRVPRHAASGVAVPVLAVSEWAVLLYHPPAVGRRSSSVYDRYIARVMPVSNEVQPLRPINDNGRDGLVWRGLLIAREMPADLAPV